MQQNQRFQWSVMSRLYLTMIVFELHFELGNFPIKSMRSPEKNLVPSSHFLPLWNISIAEVDHAKKKYEMPHIILIFSELQMCSYKLTFDSEMLLDSRGLLILQMENVWRENQSNGLRENSESETNGYLRVLDIPPYHILIIDLQALSYSHYI